MAGYGVEFPKENDYHGHPNYLRVFIYLLILLAVSLVAGYFLSPLAAIIVIFLTAIIKGGLVMANFMHLKFEPTLIWIVVAAFLFIVLALFWGVFPDIPIIDLEVAPK